MKDTKALIKEAEQAAREAQTWADLSNFLFNPVDGLVSKAYPTRAAREAFVQTAQYRKIRQLVSDARQRFGLVEGATPVNTDRLVVRLPQSLHTALEREAVEEGVSLDQLVLTTLAVGLACLTSQASPEAGEDT
jgi:predicted HicB family RNase H-like nuclease